MQNFIIFDYEGKQLIQHIAFPRFTGTITFSGDVSDVENIQVLDECTDAMLLANVLKQAGEYIYRYKRGDV